MTKKDWEKITAAKNILELEDKATLAEIKKAYRRMSKKHHPDLSASNSSKDNGQLMHKISEAYEVLMQYCGKYQFPLVLEGSEELEAEDWWMDRFGQDPLWGKSDSD